MKILITGASSGIGAALAHRYAKDGNHLILLSRDKNRLQDLQRSLSCKTDIIDIDICDFELLQKRIKEIDSIDMVILNAGISIGHSLEITPFDDFKKLYDTNLLSYHALLEPLLPKFKEKKSGTIVFISSLASLITMPSSVAYSSSKRALNAYAEGIRYKYKPHGINVVNILPGFIDTPLTQKNDFSMPFLMSLEEGSKRIEKAIEKRKRIYAFPLRFYLIIKTLGLLPQFLRERIVNSLYK
ncbi:SDR family NAD(P)-dependent oxidoreductase [Sulfurimonas sp. HSL-1716]|uniref:SDR family NAD(P)-dependent oxidoreductase n=1 Tax=Hydrocurvibacter sulfurireducens TaxID=3131937 RepID=UPI0031F8EC97